MEMAERIRHLDAEGSSLLDSLLPTPPSGTRRSTASKRVWSRSGVAEAVPSASSKPQNSNLAVFGKVLLDE